MKKIFFFAILFGIVPTFLLQSSAPPLPETSTITLTSVESGLYAIMVDVHGWDYNTMDPINEQIIRYNSSGTVAFDVGYKLYDDGSYDYETRFSVWVKATSGSNWSYKGQVWRSDGVGTWTFVGNYLLSITLSYNYFYNP